MIVVNLWFVKHTNGLFYYGLDYAEALGTAVREIWVRNASLAQTVHERLPQVQVKILSASALIAQVLRFKRAEDVLFTPSSHPLASIRRQVVVLHDSYPFESRIGRVKQWLFRVGLKLSGGTAAYINRAEGFRYLRQLPLPESRTRFLPNKISRLSGGREEAPLRPGEFLVLGLFGTDSPKKNYDELLSSFSAAAPALSVKWRLYGHRNAYTDRLRATYPDCDIEVIPSDELTMDEFLGSIDLAVSAARNEGFARPIACALMRGVPTLLLDTPVFREFYGGSATLFPSVSALIAAIASIKQGDSIERPFLATEQVLRESFEDGVAWLNAL